MEINFWQDKYAQSFIYSYLWIMNLQWMLLENKEMKKMKKMKNLRLKCEDTVKMYKWNSRGDYKNRIYY